MTKNNLYIRLYAELDMLMSLRVNLVETSCHDGTPLSHKSSDEEVVADCAIAILLQKCHQEAKTHIDHDMNILEHCEKRKNVNERKLIGHCREYRGGGTPYNGVYREGPPERDIFSKMVNERVRGWTSGPAFPYKTL